MENQKLKMDNKVNVNVLNQLRTVKCSVLKHYIIILIINVYCNKMENQKLKMDSKIKMDNKINVNVLKHNSYNSDH